MSIVILIKLETQTKPEPVVAKPKRDPSPWLQSPSKICTLGGRRGLEVARSSSNQEDRGSNLGSTKLTFEENFSLHQAKMVRTLKSTWVTGGKIPVMTSSQNSSDVEEPVLKWSGKKGKIMSTTCCQKMSKCNM